MSVPKEPSTEITSLNIIRTETALSRYPIHRLAKQGTIAIEIRRKDTSGVTTFLWEVSYNSKYGQPGPLAYKLDTLVINRRIDDVGKPVPRLIKIGSLREIARELNLDGNTNAVKKALRQNAFAGIVAKVDYKTIEGVTRHLEADFTRYSVIFAGEELEDGRQADAVYIELNDRYREVLEYAITRPLDYDYLRRLDPSPQRFYEIVSYQIYAALRYDLPRARLRYSEYCTYSTQTRYQDYDHVKKQMYKVHRPHLQEGYIAKAELQATTDEAGQPDWIMFYTPGPKAKADHRAFMERRRYHKMQGQLFTDDQVVDPAEEIELLAFVDPAESAHVEVEQMDPAPLPALTEEQQRLVDDLRAAGLNGDTAERFVQDDPDECRRQLEYLPYKDDVEKPGGWLSSAIPGKYDPPTAYRQAMAEAKAKRKQESQAQREKARQSHEEAHRAEYQAYLVKREGDIEKTHPEAYAAFIADEDRRRAYTKKMFAKSKIAATRKMAEEFETEDHRRERFAEYFTKNHKDFVVSFWEWDRTLNPLPFSSLRAVGASSPNDPTP